MKGFIVFLTFFSTLLNLEIAIAQDSIATKSLIGKQVFDAGYPKTLSFRNDRLLLKSTYANWEKGHIQFNGITKKYLNEEISMPPVAAQWANEFATKHPEKLMLVHLNGEARSVNDEATFNLYFPGHWVYEVGTSPVQAIKKNQNKIRVKDVKRFSMKAYTVHGQDIGVDFKPHDILLVKLDESGNRIWNEFEYATIINVDYKSNEIEVKRGQYGSNARDYDQEDTYIAPIAGDIWGGNLMYYYNLSSTCPLDQNGHSAADVFIGEMKGWFSKGGVLENFDGIGFDVNYFEVKHSKWDCNNDGQIDNGFIEGRNIWREGDIEFLQKIRNVFGPEFIITADGWKDDMQRAVGILNGMESEGLCRWNDGFRQISSTINQHTYWNMHNTAAYKFSYVTSKLRNPADEKIAEQLRRMGLGMASCLGVAYSPGPDLTIPEMFGGSLNQANWLGLPVGPMRYVLGDKRDVLNGEGLKFGTDLIKRFELENMHYAVEDNALILEGSDKNRRGKMQVKGPEFKVDSGDLLIFFEAKAIDGFVDLIEGSLVPRKINVRMEGLPEYPIEPMNSQKLYNELAGFIGTSGYTPQMFYFRNVGETDLRMIFEVEEQGKIAIRNLQVYNTPCVIVREFEKGVVLVNPSFESISIDLDNAFEKKMKFARLKADAKHHSGELIHNNASVTVPSLDALFLLKK
ncbi:hypothetical protein V8G56_00470 [Gaetbulibacter aquiaggeris]|uniref:Alpha-galactosidase n=1 Tax=Gaetbulibacter aquiaggeris TaxID=1735373 RepID=A0ABW7MN85_9FLAO